MALLHGEGRQFGLLPQDGANVSVWDSTVFPRYMGDVDAANSLSPQR